MDSSHNNQLQHMHEGQQHQLQQQQQQQQHQHQHQFQQQQQQFQQQQQQFQQQQHQIQQQQQQQQQQQHLMTHQGPNMLSPAGNSNIGSMPSISALHSSSQGGLAASLSAGSQSSIFTNNLRPMKNANFTVGPGGNIQPNPSFPTGMTSQLGAHNNSHLHVAASGNHQHQLNPSLMRTPSQRPQSANNTGQELATQSIPPTMGTNAMNPLAMQNNPMYPSAIQSNPVIPPPAMQSNDMMMKAMIMQNPQMNPAQVQQQMYQMHQMHSQPMQQNHTMGNNLPKKNTQPLNTEQQLMQQKHLIDNLERQIAQHQSQVNTSINTLPGAVGSSDNKTSNNNKEHPMQNNVQTQISMIQNNATAPTNNNHQQQQQQQQQPQPNGHQPVPSMIGSGQIQQPTMTSNNSAAKNGTMNNFLPINALAQNQALFQNLAQSQVGMTQLNQNNILMNLTNQNQPPTPLDQLQNGAGGIEPLKSTSPLQNPLLAGSSSSSRSGAGMSSRSGTSSRPVSSSPPATWEWQGLMDTPDRKRILVAVMEVIQNVQDGGKQNPGKLSKMAKRLEEFLYKNAKSKEEYLDLSTLKKRLQSLARFTGPGSSGKSSSSNTAMSETAHRRISLLKKRNVGAMDEFTDYQASQNKLLQQQQQNTQQMAQGQPHQMQNQELQQQQQQQQQQLQQQNQMQQHLLQQHHQLNLKQQQQNGNNFNVSRTDNNTNDNGTAMHRISNGTLKEMPNQEHLKPYNPAIAQLQQNMNNAAATNLGESQPQRELDTPKLGENDSKKAIKHQVKRLILLRHASKCTQGVMCTVKKCSQMVSLWNHMKTCRDKDCTTEHCLTSRCVLNHYRICKQKNRAEKCEICSPVMKVIEPHDSKAGNTFSDVIPLQQNIGNTDLSDALTPLLGGRLFDASISTKYQNNSDEKVLTLTELQAEQQKLNQQREFLNRLQEQQEVQQRHHQMSNIPPDSEQGLKLQKQQLLIQKCQQQFLEDQRLLKRLISRHSQRADEQKKENPDTSLNAFNNDNSQLLSFQQNDPFPGFSTEAQSFETDNDALDGLLTMKRSLSDLSTSQSPKIQKIDNHVSRSEYEPDPLNNVETQDDPQKNTLKSAGHEINKSLKQILVSQQLLPLVSSLMEHELAWVFIDPVDPVQWNLPDYFDVIKSPMDLSKVKKRLEDGYYAHVDDVRHDVSLVFDNTILYNGEKSDVGEMAIKLSSIFKNAISKLLNTTERASSQPHQIPDFY